MGAALVPTNSQGEETLASYPENGILRVKITQQRLLPHHNFFFAFLAEVFLHWPETHKIQPPDKEWMRAWLLVKAGVCERFDVAWDLLGLREAVSAIAILRRLIKAMVGNKPFWFSIDAKEGLISVEWAKSIAFEKMDQAEFSETTTKVFDVVYAETGMDVEEHYQRWQKENGKLKVEPRRSMRGGNG